LVSQADRGAEELLRQALAAALPEAEFVGEESFDNAKWQAGLRADFAWVVDPLDGTSNYVCGLPVWSTSIALCHITTEGRFDPLLGVIHAPHFDRLWHASRGGGTWLGPRQLKVRPEPPGGGWHNSMLATGFPYDVAEGHRWSNLEQYGRMQRRFQKIRRMGSAAIDCAFVAEGVYDGMWEFKLAPWDAAAGMLLIEEAGGLISRFDGSPYWPGDLDMACAATPELLSRMLGILRDP
jgi:myo-inositol-1(or 4)-monophosphatase